MLVAREVRRRRRARCPGAPKDGATLSVEFTIEPLPTESGSIYGMIATIRDITKRFRRNASAQASLTKVNCFSVRCRAPRAADLRSCSNYERLANLKKSSSLGTGVIDQTSGNTLA